MSFKRQSCVRRVCSLAVIVVMLGIIIQPSFAFSSSKNNVTQKALGGSFKVTNVSRLPDDSVQVEVQVSSRGRGGVPIKIKGANLCWKDKSVQAGFEVKQHPHSQEWQLAEFWFYGLPKTVTHLGFSIDAWLNTSEKVVFNFPKVNASNAPLTKQIGTTQMTLSNVFVNKPLPNGNWSEVFRVDNIDLEPSANKIRATFDMKYFDGYVNDTSPILTDDRGRHYDCVQVLVNKQMSIDSFSFSIPKSTQAESNLAKKDLRRTVPSVQRKPLVLREVAMFVFDPITPKPKWISIKRRGTNPPGAKDRAHVTFENLTISL